VSTHVPGAIVAWRRGWLGMWWTYSHLRRTTSPPRWRIPQLGGVAVASGPRPRWPWSRLRRARRPCVRPPPAGLGGPRRWRPRPLRPRRVRSAPASWRPCRGATDTSAAARQPGGARVPWPCAQSRGAGPCRTARAARPDAVEEDQQRRCRVKRRRGGARTCTASADAQAACRHDLVWCPQERSQVGQRPPSGPRRARTVSKHLASSMSDGMCIIAPVSPLGRDDTSVPYKASDPHERERGQLPGIRIEPKLISFNA